LDTELRKLAQQVHKTTGTTTGKSKT